MYSDTPVIFLSDDRAKHEEKSIVNGLNIVRLLNPKKYKKTPYLNYADNFSIIEDHWHWEAGLIAQEVKEIEDLKEFVKGGDTTDEDGNVVENAFYVKYNDIHVYTIAAVKELDSKVTTLQTENNLLKTKLEELEERLQVLENK
jgi:hypothetical protein